MEQGKETGSAGCGVRPQARAIAIARRTIRKGLTEEVAFEQDPHKVRKGATETYKYGM